MIDGRFVGAAGRVRAALLFAPPYVRVYRAPDDGTGPDDCDFDREIFQIARPAAPDHLDLRAALDLKQADRVAGADAVVDDGLLEIAARQIRRWAPPGAACDQLDALLHERQHAERQEIDFDKARVVAGLFV